MTSWPIIQITVATLIYAAVVAFILGASSAKAEPPAARPDTQRVYVMYPDTKWGWLFGPSKIGVSNDAARRVRTFQTAHYHDIAVYMTLPVRDARATEGRSHAAFAAGHGQGHDEGCALFRAARVEQTANEAFATLLTTPGPIADAMTETSND